MRFRGSRFRMSRARSVFRDRRPTNFCRGGRNDARPYRGRKSAPLPAGIQRRGSRTRLGASRGRRSRPRRPCLFRQCNGSGSRRGCRLRIVSIPRCSNSDAPSDSDAASRRCFARRRARCAAPGFHGRFTTNARESTSGAGPPAQGHARSACVMVGPPPADSRSGHRVSYEARQPATSAPPSTVSVAPVIQAASSDARKRAA